MWCGCLSIRSRICADVPLGHEPAVVQQHDVRRQRLHLVQHVARNEHAFAFAAQPLDDVHQIAAGHRIGAGERLVEKQHLRVVDQRLGQFDALPHALGVAADRPGPGARVMPTGSIVRSAAVARRGAAQAAEPGAGEHEIPAGHPLVKRVLLRTQADRAIQRRVVPDRLAEHADRALARPQLAGRQLQQRRLAGAVRPEQAGDARPDVRASAC